MTSPATVPVVRPGLVPRRALVDRLSRTVDRPLVLVAAPPGYGKTTALGQWIDDDDRRSVWITVEDADNDPGRILHRIASALNTGGTAQAPRQKMSVRRIAEQVRKEGRPVVIVLDDVHHLRPRPVPDLLLELVTELPAGSQLVAATRMAPPFRLGRLRAERRCAEFGHIDLAFTAEEARQALVRAGVEMTEDDLRLLVERTEGWPAGVYLAAVARRYEVELSGPLGAVTGDDAYIADYFRDELLARVRPDTVRFMLRTSVLDRMSAPLCDAVLGATDSALRLAEIEERNLFVVPLDHHRQWYRYHRLFSQALLGELRRREPGEEHRVHLRAAAWYERQGMVEQAIAQYIAGGDRVTAARLVNQHGANFIGVGRIATVRHWMTSLGRDAPLAHPPLAVTAAWTAALSGETERAQHLLLAAEQSSFPGPLPDGHASLDASISLLRAMMGTDGVDRMLVDARHAHDLAPPGSPWNALAATVLGIALMLAGGSEDATAHLEHVALLGRERPRVEAALALAELSLLSAARRDAAAADRQAAAARANLTAANIESGATTVTTYLASAHAALLRGEPVSAQRQLGAAVRHYHNVPPTAFPWLAAQAALVLGAIALALGDMDAARARLDEARRHVARLPTAGVLRNQLDALSAGLLRAGRRPSAPSAMALTAGEERVLELLPTHMSLEEIGEELFISRNTVKSHVTAIHRKLQCTSRAQAVNSARELGLLPR
jgi:LuxR family transcriptional regulator, maltose regulon positive regulatory protein